MTRCRRQTIGLARWDKGTAEDRPSRPKRMRDKSFGQVCVINRASDKKSRSRLLFDPSTVTARSHTHRAGR